MTTEEWIDLLRSRYAKRQILWTEECNALADHLERINDHSYREEATPEGGTTP